MDQLLATGAIGFLFGGISVALFNYVKFNGRLVRIETKLSAHIEHEKEWQVGVSKKLDALLKERH